MRESEKAPAGLIREEKGSRGGGRIQEEEDVVKSCCVLQVQSVLGHGFAQIVLILRWPEARRIKE